MLRDSLLHLFVLALTGKLGGAEFADSVFDGLGFGLAELIAAVACTFQVVNQAGEHAADQTAVVGHLAVLNVGQVSLVKGQRKLCSDFAAGAFGDVEELDELGVAAALKALGDIGHDRHRGAAYLVNQAQVLREGRAARKRVHFIRQGPRLLTDDQVLEVADLLTFNC